jgi:FkbM family methyltransferase
MNCKPQAFKNSVRRLLQASMGLEGYLSLFALYRLALSPVDPADRPFRAFLRLIGRDLVVLDVGANVGATTVALARRSRFVHAFEPVPVHARCVRRVARWARAKNIDVHPLAAGSMAGDVSMVLPELNGARLPGLARIAQSSEGGARITVPCVRLDTFPPLQGATVGAMKIDVEDFEAEALEGAIGLLERDQPLILAELWHTPNRKRSMDLLFGLGYQALVAGGSGRLAPFEPSRHPHCMDFIFLPRARS